MAPYLDIFGGSVSINTNLMEYLCRSIFLFSGSWVGSIVNLGKVLKVQMGVDLSSADISVAQ